MRYIHKEVADDYQEFFNFLRQNHNLTCTIEQMDEIVFEAQKLVSKLNILVIKTKEQDVQEFLIENGLSEDYETYRNTES